MHYTIPATGVVVVQWGADCIEGEWDAQFAHADELVLTPEPASLALFGLAGLLLLRGRCG